MNIQEQLHAAGVEIDNHCTDLYAKDCKETRDIIGAYEYKCNCTRFKSAIDGSQWWDIPFAYNQELQPTRTA